MRHASLPKLIGVQFYRIAGAVFLIAYLVFGTYWSCEFFINAGLGDVLKRLLAIPAAVAAHYRNSFWRAVVTAWCVIGIGDHIVAPVTAQIYGGMRTDDFPINVIPMFLGSPLGILLHLWVLRAMWLQRGRQQQSAPA